MNSDPKKPTRKTMRRIRAAKNRLRDARPAMRLVASRNKTLLARAAAELPKRRLAKQNAKSRMVLVAAEEKRRKAIEAD